MSMQYIYIRNSALITKLTENSIINKRRRRVDFLDISLNYDNMKLQQTERSEVFFYSIPKYVIKLNLIR